MRNSGFGYMTALLLALLTIVFTPQIGPADENKIGSDTNLEPPAETLTTDQAAAKIVDDMNRIMEARVKTDGNVEAQLVKVKTENEALKRENERLSHIDHLDLFEEIEDLKYKYNDAVSQINNLTRG